MISALAARERGDRVVGRDQRPQHVDHLLRRLVPQRDHLRDQAVAARADCAARDLGTVHLGLGLEHQLGDAVAFDRRDALQAQRRQQRRIDEALRHAAGRDDVHRALDPRVDDEIAAGDLGHRLHHRLDVGVDEIQRDGVVLRAGWRQRGDGNEDAGGEAESEAAQRLQQGGGWSPKRSPGCGFGGHRQRQRGIACRMGMCSAMIAWGIHGAPGQTGAAGRVESPSGRFARHGVHAPANPKRGVGASNDRQPPSWENR